MGFKKKKKYGVLSIILTLALICSGLSYAWAQADEAEPYEIVENSMGGG